MAEDEKPGNQPTTEEWARRLGISTEPVPETIPDYNEPCPFTARQIATRAVILQGVVAVACEVDPVPVVEWYNNQGIWDQVSPNEQTFLLDPSTISRDKWLNLCWHQESEWTLLWVVGKIEALGLPIRQCDTKTLVDEIMPPLGSEIEPFLASAEVRSPGILLAEDDRHYDLWCRYFQTRRESQHLLPTDIDFNVLYERIYSFVWLHGIDSWDDIRCDA